MRGVLPIKLHFRANEILVMLKHANRHNMILESMKKESHCVLIECFCLLINDNNNDVSECIPLIVDNKNLTIIFKMKLKKYLKKNNKRLYFIRKFDFWILSRTMIIRFTSESWNLFYASLFAMQFHQNTLDQFSYDRSFFDIVFDAMAKVLYQITMCWIHFYIKHRII